MSVDLHAGDEQKQLRETVRRMMDRRLAELVAELPTPPRHDAGQALADARATGLAGLGLPEDLGGAGTFADLVVAHEELGRGLAGPVLLAIAAAGRLLLRASGGARDGLLESLADGGWAATAAIDESADPVDAMACTVTAADGRLVLDGRKRRVVAGRDVADLLVCTRDASTDRPAVAVVPADSDGLQWQAEPGDSDLRSWTVTFAEVVVSPDRLLPLADDAVAGVRAELALLAAARQAGGGRAVLERTIAHVTTREQFDRPIGTFQAVQHQLADVATDLDATDLAVAQAAWAVDAAADPNQVRRLIAMAALAAGAAFRRATLVAHQLQGGMGFVLDSPLHLWSARAIGDPTIPQARRHLLDDLADASGITAAAVAVPPDHRLPT